jgi:hypothetical protein
MTNSRIEKHVPRSRISHASNLGCNCAARSPDSDVESGPMHCDPYGFAAFPFGNSDRYLPYPSLSSLSTGMNRIDAEFMQ